MMFDRKQRVLKLDKTDVSQECNDILAGTFALDTTTLYIGAEFPFNHKYFEISTSNLTAKTLSSVHLWNGTAWVAAVDIKDGTALSGVSLGRSGSISWSVDQSSTAASWVTQQDSNLMSDLSGTKIFNLYWCKITFSNASGVGYCSYIGERFNNDEDLFSHYADLRNSGLIAQYKTGKTDWKDQCLIAANAIVQHMRKNRVIVRKEQILDTSIYAEAGIHKTAEIIFSGLGNPAYQERAAVAAKKFYSAVDVKFPEVDLNADGILSYQEKSNSISYGTR